MPKNSKIKGASRIIDANLNRLREGLRVCEEIARFILNSPALTSQFKKIRHKICAFSKSPALELSELLKERRSSQDVGKNIYINELKRRDFRDIFFANIQRVKESVRVLEEFSKLTDKNLAKKIKNLRYDIYGLEKKAAGKISSLFDL